MKSFKLPTVYLAVLLGMPSRPETSAILEVAMLVDDGTNPVVTTTFALKNDLKMHVDLTVGRSESYTAAQVTGVSTMDVLRQIDKAVAGKSVVVLDAATDAALRGNCRMSRLPFTWEPMLHLDSAFPLLGVAQSLDGKSTIDNVALGLDQLVPGAPEPLHTALGLHYVHREMQRRLSPVPPEAPVEPRRVVVLLSLAKDLPRAERDARDRGEVPARVQIAGTEHAVVMVRHSEIGSLGKVVTYGEIDLSDEKLVRAWAEHGATVERRA